MEAEYMWGLLHPSLLSGEGGYYLTALSSAVNVLKNFRRYRNGGGDAVNNTPVRVRRTRQKEDFTKRITITFYCSRASIR